MWSVDTTTPIFTLVTKEKVKCVEWINLSDVPNEDSLFLSGGFDQIIRLWAWNRSTMTVDCSAIYRGHKETVMTVATSFRPDDKSRRLLASGSWDTMIKVWSASPEGTDLVEETGGIAHVKKSDSKINTRIPLLTMSGHREVVTKVFWLREEADCESATPSSSKLISCSWDHTIRIWDCASASASAGELRCIVSGSALQDLSAAPQGVLVAASDNKIRIYDLRAKEALAQVGFKGHLSWLTCVSWAPHRTDQFVTGSVDRTVRLWDTRKLTASLYDLMGHTDMVTGVDWAQPFTNGDSETDSPQHYILSCSADGSAKVYRYAA